MAGTETMWVRAFDGNDWSDWDAFTFTSAGNNPPVASIADHQLTNNQSARVQDWLSYSDAEGNAATQYQFWDGGTGSKSGYFSMPDTGRQAAGAAFTVAAEDLADLVIRGGKADGSETMWVRAFDGNDWSAWDPFTLTTI